MTIEEARIKLSIIKNSHSIRNYFCTDMTHQEKALIDYENLVIGLIKENQKQKEVIDKSIKCIDYNNRYRNGADIYQFVDIKSEILEPLKDILEQNEENSNIYLKEFNDWLKEVD